ncbi:hypothetical protein BH10PSE2_BH10PSE2_16770 [soil metagenome]
MSFSASDAAFEGFRQVRRHPLALVYWAVAYAAVMGLAFLIAGPLFIDVMSRAEALKGVIDPSMTDLEGMGRSYATLFALVMPLALVFSAVLSAAVARAVLRPSEKSFGYMRLGADELRVLGVSILLGLVIAAAWLMGCVLVSLVAGVAGATGIGLLWIPAVLLGVGVVVAVAWLSVRLSLAVPIVVAERRFTLFASYALTKGHTLALLGMAIIAGVMTLLVSLLGAIVAMPITAISGGAELMTELGGQDVMQILAHAWPAILSWILVNAILSALQLAVLYAPFSAAYRDIKGLPHL